MGYFSDAENRKNPQTVTEIPYSFWCAIVSRIHNEFGHDYLDDIRFHRFMDALGGEVPLSPRPLNTTKQVGKDWDVRSIPYVPDRSTVLDIIQYFYKYLDPSIAIFRSTDQYKAVSFRDHVNTLFARNALAFKLLKNGSIERLINPVLGDSIKRVPFNSGDEGLDRFLDKAVSKFLHHDFNTRKESLEALWDAFERIKTMYDPDNKLKSVGILLDKSSDCQNLRTQIDTEAQALKKIGNDFMIRHTEMNKFPINEEKHVDYLFHRMFALIWLWLESAKGN